MDDIVKKILMAMGLTEEDIPVDVIEYWILAWQEVYPDNECLVLHNTVLSLYEWLIRQSAKDASGGGKVKEKEGLAEIELDRYNKSVDWEKALEDYLKAPWLAFPFCKEELAKGIINRVKVGGVRKDEICKIKRDKNIRDGGASEISGVRQPNAMRYRRTGPRDSFLTKDDDCDDC